MSDNSWVLRGVDPEARESAEAEAARLGVSVAEYLADLVVRQAVIDQLTAPSEVESTSEGEADALIFAPQPESHEGFAVRQRLKALERRLGTAVGSLDGAISALDTSLFDITARVGDVEALAGDTAHALGQTQQEVTNAVAGLQIHLAVVEDNLEAQAEAQSGRVAELDSRIDGVEQTARSAERSAAILADAHEALKHAVAADFTDFAHETVDRLNHNLAELRAAADAAAEQADAAVEHLVGELRGLRASIERRLEESAEDTRGRMHAAFADAADRMAALGVRVSDAERLVSRTAEQLRAQMADVEDGAQVALEATAQSLRDSDAALAADLARGAQEYYAALEATRADIRARIEASQGELVAQIGALREDQVSQLARLKLVDVAVGNTVNGIADLRGALETRAAETEGRVDAALQQASADWSARLESVAGRLVHGEQQTQQAHQRLNADLDRVEASAFAALERVRRDLGAGDAAAAQRLDEALVQMGRELDEVRTRAINETHLLREEHAGALARLTLLDNALTRLEGASITTNGRIEDLETAVAGGNPQLERRIEQLEYAAAHAQTDQALQIVRSELASLRERLDGLCSDTGAADRLTALQRGLDAQDSRADEFQDTLQGMARMLNRVAAQSVDTAQRTEQRTHEVEVALADLRLDLLAKTEANNPTGAMQALQERMTAFELRQANAMEALRADIARFVSDNDRRLETLEAREHTTDQRDLAAEFETLRARVEERVLGVELRSVRTLEQVVDTVALLEQRLLGAPALQSQDAQSA